MSKLMYVLGILLMAVGIAFAVLGWVNPGQLNVNGMTMDTAAILLTGGVLALGLGGVIAAQGGQRAASFETVVEDITVDAPAVTIPAVAPSAKMELPKVELPKVEVPPVPAVEEPASRVRFNPFTRKSVDAAASATASAAAVVAAAPAVAATPIKSGVDDTIAALEQAKADIANAVGGIATATEAKVEEVVGDVVEDEDVAEADGGAEGEDGELYVVEEREIRGRPARILSDDTVEAETDEGWMRFENLEHLNEYLDAMGEPA
jgi:hypothetical protein